jgi:lysozyme family protein
MGTMFDRDIAQLLKDEGGYTPGLTDDPGGETNKGITKRSYPDLDIKALSDEEITAIYRRDFADPLHYDDLPPMLAFMALTFAVNSGLQTAIRKLQAAAGVADDGHWGPVTTAAVKATPQIVLLLRFVAECVEYRTKLSNFQTFAKGWDARLANDLRFIASEAA